MITLNYFISLNYNHLVNEHNDYVIECEENHKEPMDFDEFCVDRFESLDNSDEAYENFKDSKND